MNKNTQDKMIKDALKKFKKKAMVLPTEAEVDQAISILSNRDMDKVSKSVGRMLAGKNFVWSDWIDKKTGKLKKEYASKKKVLNLLKSYKEDALRHHINRVVLRKAGYLKADLVRILRTELAASEFTDFQLAGNLTVGPVFKNLTDSVRNASKEMIKLIKSAEKTVDVNDIIAKMNIRPSFADLTNQEAVKAVRKTGSSKKIKNKRK